MSFETFICIIGGGGFILTLFSLMFIAALVYRAKPGWEDETGFHEGEQVR